MTAVAWPILPPLAALAEGGADDAPDLLRISVVIALVVASVVAVSFALRPLLPPSRRPMSDAELDERTLRGLGLAGDPDRPPTQPARRRAEVIPFPRGPRDPILDENERLYRDPIVAARLREVLDPGRRSGRTSSSSPARPAGAPATGQPPAPLVGPRRVAEHDRRRVRHTEGEPPARARDGSVRAQEPAPMPPPDTEPLPGDVVPGSVVDRGSAHGRRQDPPRSPEEIEGSPPSSVDLDRLSAGEPQPRSKVVPFIPRQTPPDPATDETAVDRATVEAITATVRELLFCANVGEYLHGFALYSDRYLFRFMDETGMTVDEFRAAFEDAPAREPDDWTRLSHIGDVRRLDDGRVTAVVTYVDGERPGGSERYTFEFSTTRGLWLIDDIQQV